MGSGAPKNKVLDFLIEYLEKNPFRRRRIRKTNKYGVHTLYETKVRWRHRQQKKSFFEKNMSVKFSTLASYKSYILRAHKLGYDFDLHRNEGISHLKNFIQYQMIRQRKGRGG